jgi:hypothetical protein
MNLLKICFSFLKYIKIYLNKTFIFLNKSEYFFFQKKKLDTVNSEIATEQIIKYL